MKKSTDFSRFYTLLKRVSGDKAIIKETLVSEHTNGRTTSLREMSVTEYNRMLDNLQAEVDHPGVSKEEHRANDGKAAEMDVLRKRCIRCLCDYMDARGLEAEDKVGYAKQIACRSTKRPGFNQITAAELRGLIGGFNKERKAIEAAIREAKFDALLVDCGQGRVRTGEA